MTTSSTTPHIYDLCISQPWCACADAFGGLVFLSSSDMDSRDGLGNSRFKTDSNELCQAPIIDKRIVPLSECPPAVGRSRVWFPARRSESVWIYSQIRVYREYSYLLSAISSSWPPPVFTPVTILQCNKPSRWRNALSVDVPFRCRFLVADGAFKKCRCVLPDFRVNEAIAESNRSLCEESKIVKGLPRMSMPCCTEVVLAIPRNTLIASSQTELSEAVYRRGSRYQTIDGCRSPL